MGDGKDKQASQPQGHSPASAPYRPVAFFSSEVETRVDADGALLMRSAEPLAAYDVRIGDWLDRWSTEAPERIFIVEQTESGERSISYRETRESALAIAEVLLAHQLDSERPLAILAPAGIDHAVIICAAHHIGVPIAPIAPAYALQSHDYAKLRQVMQLLTPGLVVVADGVAYRKALAASVAKGVPVVAIKNADVSSGQLSMRALRGSGSQRAAVAAAAARVVPDTVAKFLFTSGSTGLPKAVVNTHRMLCAGAQMQRQVTAFLREEPPVMVDWLPWNHTAGGNSIFSIVLRNGGTLYIDPGRPDPEHIEATLRLLRRVSPTLYFNVPLGFDALIPHLRNDEALRKTFFRNLKFIWYAAAAMKPSTWDALEALAMDTIGERLLILTGLGMTETSPVALFGNLRANGVGVVGVPAPGVELKLIPRDDQYEALFRGPNVTPGYWRNPEATRDAFDQDGYFRSGDLLSFVDEGKPEAGLRFEGRATDDFKLASGTRVAGGALRMAALAALAPLISDVVVVGPGRSDVRALLFPDWAKCAHFSGLASQAPPRDVVSSQALKEELRRRLAGLAASATGSSNRIVAGLLMLELPSASGGEVTEKGTINGRFVQRNRAPLVDALYDGSRFDLLVEATDQPDTEAE